MSKPLLKIPRQLSLAEFNLYIDPYIPYGTRGPNTQISWHEIFNYILKLLYTGIQWSELPIRLDHQTNNKPAISYKRIHKHFMRLVSSSGPLKMFTESVKRLAKANKLDISILHGDGTASVAKLGGDNLGRKGHKHHKGDKVIAICDRNCNIIAPLVAAPGNASEMKLFPDAFHGLKKIVKELGLSIKGGIMSLDGGYDSRAIRKMIFNAGMTPNIKENPRNRKGAKRGRPRIYSDAIYDERFQTIERDFAWEDTFRRLVIRYEKKSIAHYALKLIAYMLINLRKLIKIN